MPIGLILLVLLVGWPLLEIAVFIAVGGEIGILQTILLILATSALGALLLRAQGFAALRTIARDARGGGVPLKALGHAALIGAGGALLLLPGFVSDVLGIILFLPPVRALILAFIAARGPEVVVRQRHARRPGVVDLDPQDWQAEPGEGHGGAGREGGGRVRLEDRRPGDPHRR